MKSARTRSVAVAVALVACVGLVTWTFCGASCVLQCRYEEHADCDNSAEHSTGSCDCCSDEATVACGQSWIALDSNKCMCAPLVGAGGQQPAVFPERVAQSNDFIRSASAWPDIGPRFVDRVACASIVNNLPTTLRSLRTVSLLL